MRYNIIGDIHGQTKWKDLIIPGTITIFVGDYFSPYFPIQFYEQKKNFLEIMKFEENNEEDVICLLGNHDLEYFFTAESYSRHDRSHEREIEELFKDYLDYFQMAYSIEDKVLVTHAGVTKDWFSKAQEFHKQLFDDQLIDLEVTPLAVSNIINGLFYADSHRLFEFSPNASYRSDYCGESPTQSCVWIRPWTLRQCDLFAGKYKQVFGHTISKSLSGVDPIKGFDEDCLVPLTDDNINDFNLYMVDCLSFDKASLVYNSETEKFSINRGADPREVTVEVEKVSDPDKKSETEAQKKYKDNLNKLLAFI